MGPALQTSADMLRFRKIFISVESANSMMIMEEYIFPFRRQSNIIPKEAPMQKKHTLFKW